MPDPTPEPATPEPTTPAPSATPTPETTPEPLGDGGKAALESERKARKDAEKAARDAQKKLDDIEAANLTKEQAAEKRAEQAEARESAATAKLRNANLRDAIAAKGFSGPQAKAVAKLLDGLEYDGDDEPTNLDARLEAAGEEYGDFVTPNGHQPVPTFDGGARTPSPAAKTPEQEHQDLVSALIAGSRQQ
jgi:hypothetical protein